MPELCKDLKLSIWREDDPEEKDKEQVRVKLENELEMLEVTVCQQINVTTQQSRRYHIKEAVVIVLRQAVSEAFRAGLIIDSLGAWKITKPSSHRPTPAEVEIDLTDSML
jgi:hypothetical protein